MWGQKPSVQDQSGERVWQNSVSVSTTISWSSLIFCYHGPLTPAGDRDHGGYVVCRFRDSLNDCLRKQCWYGVGRGTPNTVWQCQVRKGLVWSHEAIWAIERGQGLTVAHAPLTCSDCTTTVTIWDGLTFLLCDWSAFCDIADEDAEFIRLERTVGDLRLDSEAKFLVTTHANQFRLKQQLGTQFYALILLRAQNTAYATNAAECMK